MAVGSIRHYSQILDEHRSGVPLHHDHGINRYSRFQVYILMHHTNYMHAFIPCQLRRYIIPAFFPSLFEPASNV